MQGSDMICLIRGRVLFLILGVVLLSVAGCVTEQSNPKPSSLPRAEDWVWELERKNAPASELRTFRTLGRREWERGVLVFIRYRDETGTEMFGYSLLEPNSEGGDWTTAGGQLYGPATLDPTEFIDWSVGSGGGMTIVSGTAVESHLEPVVFYGLTSEEVRAVEVTFVNDPVQRDQTNDHMFAIVVGPEARACNLIAYGDDDKVLRTIQLAEEIPGSQGVAKPEECGG
jgi:hypothetical protein